MESVFYKYLSLQNDSIQFARQKPSLWLFWGILDDFCGFFGKKIVFRGMFRYNSQQMNLFTEGVGLMENKYESLRETLRQRAKREFAPGAKFPTQRALMAEYGVSLATVDRALRELVADGILMRSQGRGTFVREETELRKPAGNQIALLLARNVTCNAHAFYAEILFEINDRISAAGCSFAYFYTDESGTPRELVRHLTDGGCFRGAILINRIPEELAVELKRVGLPFVVVDNRIESPGVCCVTGENEAGAAAMVEYLIARGHRRIGFVSTPLQTTFLERYIGYCNTLLAHGIAVDNAIVQRFFRYEEAERDLAKLLDCAEPPTAIFAANDTMGAAVYRVLRKRGLHIPGDISVAGFDGDYVGTQCVPRLTTVEVPRREMGRAAASALLRQIAGEKVESIVLPLKLIERESVFALT